VVETARLPEEYTTTTNSSCNTTTAVFCSPESLERLANAQTFFIFMDGTFSVQGLDIVVTLGHNLGKDLAGFVSGVGCQVFHGISGF
jgi:hypothetical protein